MYTTLVPARFSSLKALHLVPRRSTEMSGFNSYSIGSRINPQFSSCWYRLGSFLCPQKPINLINKNSTGTFAEGFMETLRSFHALNSYLVSSSITPDYYNRNDAGTTDGSQYKLANLQLILIKMHLV